MLVNKKLAAKAKAKLVTKSASRFDSDESNCEVTGHVIDEENEPDWDRCENRLSPPINEERMQKLDQMPVAGATELERLLDDLLDNPRMIELIQYLLLYQQDAVKNNQDYIVNLTFTHDDKVDFQLEQPEEKIALTPIAYLFLLVWLLRIINMRGPEDSQAFISGIAQFAIHDNSIKYDETLTKFPTIIAYIKEKHKDAHWLRDSWAEFSQRCLSCGKNFEVPQRSLYCNGEGKSSCRQNLNEWIDTFSKVSARQANQMLTKRLRDKGFRYQIPE
jgi:hypothetical protein